MCGRMRSETCFHYNLEMKSLDGSYASPSLLLFQQGWVVIYQGLKVVLDQIGLSPFPRATLQSKERFIKENFWTEGSSPRSKEPWLPHISISVDTETICRGRSVADESVTGANRGGVDKNAVRMEASTSSRGTVEKLAAATGQAGKQQLERAWVLSHSLWGRP